MPRPRCRAASAYGIIGRTMNTYIPGIRIKTSPTDFYPIEQVQMMRFTGEKWQLFADHRRPCGGFELIRQHQVV